LAGPTGGGVPGTALPVLGGCQIFPADNAWNRDVSGEPVHPNSASLLAAMSPESPIHLDLGTTQEYYGIPYTVVPRDQPLVPISYGTDGVDYSDESDPGPMPIPLDAPIEGGSSNAPDPATGDRHVLVLRQVDCQLFELYNAERTGSGFRVSSSAIWDLIVNAGSAWYITGTSEPAWTDALDQLRRFPVRGSDFEVLQSGAVITC
jgi:hypothetical protein